MDGAEARILEKNPSAGEFLFELAVDGRTLTFRTNQEAIAENWVNWALACSNEKRFQDTLKQFIQTGEKDEDAERILNDPVAMEKKVSAEIVKSILTSYYDIVRGKLIDAIPKVRIIIIIIITNSIPSLISIGNKD